MIIHLALHTAGASANLTKFEAELRASAARMAATPLGASTTAAAASSTGAVVTGKVYDAQNRLTLAIERQSIAQLKLNELQMVSATTGAALTAAQNRVTASSNAITAAKNSEAIAQVKLNELRAQASAMSASTLAAELKVKSATDAVTTSQNAAMLAQVKLAEARAASSASASAETVALNNLRNATLNITAAKEAEGIARARLLEVQAKSNVQLSTMLRAQAADRQATLGVTQAKEAARIAELRYNETVAANARMASTRIAAENAHAKATLNVAHAQGQAVLAQAQLSDLRAAGLTTSSAYMAAEERLRLATIAVTQAQSAESLAMVRLNEMQSLSAGSASALAAANMRLRVTTVAVADAQAALATAEAAATAGAIAQGNALTATNAKALPMIGTFATIGGLAAAMFGHGAIKAAADYQYEMKLLVVQAGADIEELEKMSEALINMAADVRTGPRELARGLFHIESVGIRSGGGEGYLANAKALDVLTTAAKGAIVGNANLESVTNALIAAVVSGIKGVDDMSHAMGTLNGIVGSGNLRMQELASSLSSGVLSTAKVFGLSILDVGAALATMADQGIPAEEAATRLRITIALIGAPTRIAERELARVGLSGRTLADSMRGPSGLIGTLALLQAAMDKTGLDAVEQSQLLKTAFGGSRSSAGLLTLLTSLDLMGQKYEQISARANNFEEDWQHATTTATVHFKELGAAVEALQVRFGNQLLPIILPIVHQLATLAQQTGILVPLFIVLGAVITFAAARALFGLTKAMLVAGREALLTAARFVITRAAILASAMGWGTFATAAGASAAASATAGAAAAGAGAAAVAGGAAATGSAAAVAAAELVAARAALAMAQAALVAARAQFALGIASGVSSAQIIASAAAITAAEAEVLIAMNAVTAAELRVAAGASVIGSTAPKAVGGILAIGAAAKTAMLGVLGLSTALFALVAAPALTTPQIPKDESGQPDTAPGENTLFGPRGPLNFLAKGYESLFPGNPTTKGMFPDAGEAPTESGEEDFAKYLQGAKDAAEKSFTQLSDKLIDMYGTSLAGVQQAAQDAGAKDMLEYANGIRSAVSAPLDAIQNMFDVQKTAVSEQVEMSRLYGFLSSKELAAGINDGRPQVAAAAEAARIAAVERLDEITDFAFSAGTNAATTWQDSFRSKLLKAGFSEIDVQTQIDMMPQAQIDARVAEHKKLGESLRLPEATAAAAAYRDFVASLESTGSAADQAARIIEEVGTNLDGLRQIANTAGGDVMLEVAKGIRQKQNAPLDALKDLHNMMKDQFSTNREIALLWTELNSKTLVDGMKSSDPAVLAQAQATTKIITDRLDELTGGAYTKSLEAGANVGIGLGAAAPVVTAGAMTAVSGVGPVLDTVKDYSKTSGENSGTGLAAGWISKAKDIIDSVIKVVTPVANTLFEMVGISFRLGAAAGESFAEGYKNHAGYQAFNPGAVIAPPVTAPTLTFAEILAAALKDAGDQSAYLNRQLNGTASALKGTSTAAADMKDKIKTAFGEIKDAAKRYFDTLHDKNKQAINDARDLAKEMRQGEVDRARDALSAKRDNQQLFDLQRAVNEAKTPEEREDAMIALGDFQAQLQIDAQQRLVDAANKIEDEKAEIAQKAEDARHDKQIEGFNRELATLQRYMMRHPEEWKSGQKKVLALLAKHGIDYVKAGALLGSEFATGLRNSIQEAVDAAKALKGAVDAVIAGKPPPKPKVTPLASVPSPYKVPTGGPTIKPYATGSWKLMEDQLALVHQGEMIVPSDTADLLRSIMGGSSPYRTIASVPVGSASVGSPRVGTAASESSGRSEGSSGGGTIIFQIGSEKLAELMDRGLSVQGNIYAQPPVHNGSQR